MSCRRICLCSSQLSFLDVEACSAIKGPPPANEDDARPWKRRKLDAEGQGWSGVVEFDIECRFVNETSTPSSSNPLYLDTPPVDASVSFDDPIMTVTEPVTDRPLFAFICQEVEVPLMEKFAWFQKLIHKDPSTVHCIRLFSSLSMRKCHETIERATVSLRVEIRFDQSLTHVTRLSLKDRLAILDYAFEKPSTEVNADHFYTSVGRLPKDYIQPEEEKSFQHPSITCRLFPFQKRAVAWMLQREGVYVRKGFSGIIDKGGLPPLWEIVNDLDNRPIYLNRHQAFVTVNEAWVSEAFKAPTILGGILAEEMGLGKTIELIDLILMHPRPQKEIPITVNGSMLQHAKATIIITPPTILSQWAGEFADRAPSLKVFIYPGVQNLPVDFDSNNFLDYDVILATYPILSKELHFATPPPDRSMRYRKTHQPRRSPLVGFTWWRVCLDEAQMIEGSVTSAALVACMMPRNNAWCVSGTPCKRDVSDLYGLLVFLQYRPIANDSALWNRICRDWDTFYRIFEPLVCRNTKQYIKDEMALPPQTKALLSVDFTAVEEINYQHIFEQMLDDCGLTANGSPARPDGAMNDRVTDKMKKWLVRLRQACSHPGVGSWRSGAKEMRTMDEVLEKMYEDTSTAINRDERELFISKIKRGQIYDYKKDHNEALELWAEVLQKVLLRVKAKQAEVLELRISTNSLVDSESSVGSDDDQDLEDERRAKKLQHLRTKRANELRDLLELQHRATFMMASANFQLKNEAEELRLYDEAEALRREILRHPIRRVNHFIKRLNNMVDDQQFVEIPEFRQSGFSGGILTRKVFERLQPFVDQMNAQANQLDDWREKVIQRLRLPLLDQTTDPDGEEYQGGLDAQEEASSYQEVLRQAVAGRIQVTSGFLNELVRDDILRQKNLDLKLTPLQVELWKRREEIQPKLPQSDSPLAHEFANLKAAIDVLRTMVGTISDDAMDTETSKGPMNWRRNEITIAQTEIRRLQQCLADQNKANAALEKEVELFRTIYNVRIEYYRQLQLVSDTLDNYGGDDPEGDLQKLAQAEKQLEPKVARNHARRRYLQELRTWEDKLDLERLCVICQSNFDIGALTKCGHLFCFACLQIWLKSHHTCPVCKERITDHDWHKIATQKADVVLRGTESSHHDHTFSQAIYEAVDGKVLQQIQLVELKASFGSKIDNLTRHLLWIKAQGGAKAVVFSQWSDVLDVMERSFNLNGIGYVRFDQKQKNGGDAVKLFKTSSEIQVFMLHSQSQSSGLSLVDATHCFLVEPLINSAIELQAVSRIHRMGQTKPVRAIIETYTDLKQTFVWLYTVNDEGTVEERVLDVSSRKRLGELNDSPEGSSRRNPSLGVQLDQTEALGLQQHVGKLLERRGIGEVVETGELWKCLFGDAEQNRVRQQILKEVHRDQRASAAEARRRTMVAG